MKTRPITILMAEDNPADVDLTKECLARAKVANELHVVGDGEEAMAFLRKEGGHEEAPTPDLIFLDLNMPKKGGLEVLEELKADAALRAIPVVVLTSSSAEEDIARSYDLHANCYITKPVDLSGLTEVVRSIESFWFSVVKLPRRES